jgi:hypothetical protein
VRKLIESVSAALGTSRQAEALDELQQHFRELAGEALMYRRAFPGMPRTIMRAWIEHDRDGFTATLETYDGHAAENSSFGYGDVIADFYAAVFGMSEDLGIRRILLAGLVRTGYALNRLHVGDVVRDLLASLAKPAEVSLAVEAIDENQQAAEWYAESTLRRPVRAPIAAALRRAQQAVSAGRATSA